MIEYNKISDIVDQQTDLPPDSETPHQTTVSPEREPVDQTVEGLVNLTYESAQPKQTTRAVVIKTQYLNVREVPNSSGGILCIVSLDDEVQVEDHGPNWTRICTSSDIHGYVLTDYIRTL